MIRLKNKIILLILVFAFLSSSGCMGSDSRQAPSYTRYTSYRDIPGITAREIEAIELLREQYDFFVYAMPASTEAFVNENGEIRGFSALVCEWLTELFDIHFVPEIRPFAQVLSGFESGEIDFTGTMTPTEERLKIYHMTDPIANRTLKYFMLRDSESISVIQASRLPRLALLEGSSVAANVMVALEANSFEPVFIENNSVVYDMLKSGEIDAFVHENPTEAIFDAYTDVISADFLPLVVSPVSLTALRPELEPIISVVQKAIEHDGIRHLTEMYNRGKQEYRQNKLITHLTEEERNFIQNNPVIRFVAEHDNYPISFYNAHEGEFQGIAHDVINEVAALTGLRFELANDRSADWAEIFNMLENGEVSMVTELIRSPEREGRFLWNEAVIATDRHALLSRTEKDSVNLNEVLYLRAGVIAGYAHTEIFNQWFPYHRYVTVFDNFDQAFSAMENNEIDVVMGSENKLLVRTNFLGQPGYKVNLVFDYTYNSTFGFNINEAILCSITDKALLLINTDDIESRWTRRTYDYRVQLARQQLYWVIIAVAMLICIIFIAAVLFNISKRKKRAEKESRFKSQFLAMMSHEIRTPMNAIMGISQIELGEGDVSERTKTSLERIHNSGNVLLGIINDILDMSKIETGKLELNLIKYDTANLINDAVQFNIMRIGTKPIEFKLEIDESFPAQLCGDELRIKQILNNLLSNAIKYTEKGYVKLSVSHKPDNGGVVLKFDVEDTGQGMKQEDKERLFTEYQRFNIEANRTTEGTGLGLSITKNLVEIMNGTFSAESEYEKGSIFTVTLKQEATECEAIGAKLADRLRNFTFTDHKQTEKIQITREPMPYGSILVVDDVETNLYVAEGLMSPYGLKIETADSGFSAIAKVKSGNKYDVIFMDHMMPKMDGVETVAKLRESGYTGTIVALTANALVGNDEMFKQNGFDGFITKPIDLCQLNSVLNKFIRDRHPDEAKKYKPETVTQASEINPKLIQIFRRDAEKAITTLRETIANGDIKLFTTTVHAIKSASASVREHEISKVAAVLERDGFTSDTAAFIKMLEALVVKYKPAGADESVNLQDEDTAFLEAQLAVVKTACENYDAKAAYTALELLKEKPWKSETRAIIDEIHDLIYLSSDFDGAEELLNRKL